MTNCPSAKTNVIKIKIFGVLLSVLGQLQHYCPTTYTALLVPIKNLAAVTGAVALSRGLSVRNHTVIQASIITGANGDDNDFSLSLLRGEITKYFKRKLLNTLWTV